MNFLPILLILITPLCFNIAHAFDAAQQKEMVAVHNTYRTTVGAPPLTWSAKLASTAQNHADKLKLSQSCKPTHSSSSELGENLYWASAMFYSDGTRKPQAVTPSQVTHSWASEKAHYSYETNTCSADKVCGHYTQIIWEETTQIGCGYSVCTDNSQVWVCNYTPAGNIVGQKPY